MYPLSILHHASHRIPAGRLHQLLQLGGGHRLHNAGHLALRQVLESPDIDFVCSPTSYAFRQLGGLGTTHFMSLVDSVRRHGKLWFDENDVRTSISPGTLGTWGKPADIAGDKVQQDKELACVLTAGVAQWWFDVGSNRYDVPELRAVVRNLTRVAQDAQRLDRTPSFQAALVVDAASIPYMKVGDRLGSELLVRQLPRLHRAGFPVGHASVVSRSDYLTSAVTDASGSQAATTPRPGDVSVTASAGTQRSRTFAGTIIRFLLILLCVAIVCAMIYGVVILISAYRYSKKQGAQSPKKPADDADKPQKSEKGE